MVQQKQRMWTVTFSPKGDISDERVEKYMEWVSKHCEMWRVITEEGPEVKKHMHSIVLFSGEGKTKQSVQVSLKTVFDMSLPEWGAFRSVQWSKGHKTESVMTAYNEKWYSEYLFKTGPESFSHEESDNWEPEKAVAHYVAKKEKLEVNSKFAEIYPHYNGEKDLSTWFRQLVATDVIDHSFMSSEAAEKRFLMLFGLWVAHQD